MSASPTYDVYLSYSHDDTEIVGELHRRLTDSGLRVWRDEQIELGSDWAKALASALASARFAAICIGPSGLAPGQLREVDAAEAHAANDPDFRFGGVLLPGVPADLSAAALPVQLARRQWIDLRSGFSKPERNGSRRSRPPRSRHRSTRDLLRPHRLRQQRAASAARQPQRRSLRRLSSSIPSTASGEAGA